MTQEAGTETLQPASEWRRWTVVVLFAIAMAWMESATVVYLRTLVGRLDPYQADPLPLHWALGRTEIIREAATMVMLVTAGWLAGRSARTRFAYWSLAFGVWDIFYYVFLAVIGPWPKSIADWDVLFLIPLPWWGPVWSPASIALLMAAGGTLVAIWDRPEHPVFPSRAAWFVGCLGAAVALLVFMQDAIGAVSGGFEALRTTLPTRFNTPLFLVGLALMAVPVADAWRQVVGSAASRSGACAGDPVQASTGR